MYNTHVCVAPYDKLFKQTGRVDTPFRTLSPSYYSSSISIPLDNKQPKSLYDLENKYAGLQQHQTLKEKRRKVKGSV